jgi:chorismate mutase
MARTRTPGIRVDRNGGLIIDKEHCGIPIYVRLGVTSQEEAEQRLAKEIDRLDARLQHNATRRASFADCAARYLAQSKNKRSVDATAWHIRLLIPYIGNLEVHQIHDGTLEPFVADRVAQASAQPRSIGAWRSCALSSIGRRGRTAMTMVAHGSKRCHL